MTVCIWCKDANPEPSVEEILLASLGGSPEFVFRDGEVCRPCNNGLGHLDQAVADELDVNAFHLGLRRRHNRPPEVRNRGNFAAYVTPNGPVYAINMERYPVVTPDGVRLAPWRGGNRDIRAAVKALGTQGEVSFPTTIGKNPKFVRGLHKVAFELLAFFSGAENVLGDEYDPLRRFVRRGMGRRHALCWPIRAGEPAQPIATVWTNARGGHCVEFCIAGLVFVVDTTPTQEALPKIVEYLTTANNRAWFCCPPWAA